MYTPGNAPTEEQEDIKDVVQNIFDQLFLTYFEFNQKRGKDYITFNQFEEAIIDSGADAEKNQLVAISNKADVDKNGYIDRE